MGVALPSRYRAGRVAVLVLAAVPVMVAGCGADGTGSEDPQPPRAASSTPDAIRCGTQYRPNAENLVGVEEPDLLVERVDDMNAEPVRHEFATMTVEVTFQGEAPEGNDVVVVVETSEGREILRSLYQFTTGSELRTDFSGGHGFTGLNYVSHGAASLQVWCRAA
jgi:hypothetical protein